MKKIADISAFEALQNIQTVPCSVFNAPDFDKPVCQLVGQDGNIFNLVGIASRCLRRAKQPEKQKK